MAKRVPRGLFVTGTDTGVGKTQIAAALARLLAERNLIVRPRKPVESGCQREGNRLVPEDARALRAAARTDEPLERICPYPLEPALSPERAAELAGMSLALDDVRAACLEGVAETDFLLVEGAGGFYSPLAPGLLNADLAAALPLPVLLVAADRLGTIGHTLLTVEAIKRRGLALVGVVLNRIDACGDPRMDNAADLSRWLGRPVVVTERFDAGAVQHPGWMMLCPALAPLADRLAVGFRPHRF
ncbi:MAG: dethiobiotin synthase [Methylotetracoccus sp.]|nr:dethiobiotin synthase [Methylotetracoccus sp.]